MTMCERDLSKDSEVCRAVLKNLRPKSGGRYGAGRGGVTQNN